MKVRIIVRVPNRLLSGVLGGASKTAEVDEISTADTMNSLLAFDDTDYLEKLNGTSQVSSGLEYPGVEPELGDQGEPYVEHDVVDLPEADELSHLLDFDEIETWSKSSGTLPDDSALFSTESRSESLAEIEEPAAEAEPEDAESGIRNRPIEAQAEASPAVQEETKDPAEELQEYLFEVPSAETGDRTPAKPPAIAQSEVKPAEAAQGEVAHNLPAEETGQRLDEPWELEEAEVPASAESTVEPPASEKPATSSESTVAPLETPEESTPTVQETGGRDDVVRNALRAMPWWQRWEKLEQAKAELQQESALEQDLTAPAASQPEESARALNAGEETDAVETEAGQDASQPEASTPNPAEAGRAFSPTEAEENEPLRWIRESETEQIDKEATFTPSGSSRSAEPLPDLSASGSLPADTEAEEPYIPATPGTDHLSQALEQEHSAPEDAATEEADTVFSWSAYDRPQGKVMVPLSEKVVTTRRRRTIAAISTLVVVLLGSAGWLYKSQTDPIRALKSMESGRRRLAVGDYGEAILDLNNAISIDPDNAQIVDAYLLRGRAHVAMGRAEEALPDFTKAIQRAPNNQTAYMDRGLAYFDVGLFNQALSDAGKIVELDPESADGYALRGMALRETGNPDAALDDFNRAVELAPNLANHLQRGLLLQKMGRHEEAIEDFNEAIYLNPASPTAYFSRAQSLRELGEEAAATRDHRTARYLDGR